ncbi:hypothetical protein Tco_0897708 [Tanacetum coccineum]
MSIQEMEDLKQHYLDEMQSISNQIQIKDYRNERIDIRFRRECEIMIDELKGKFNGMRDENLSTIPEKESDEFIKSSVEDLIPISSESEDTSESDSESDLPSCNDFTPIPEEKSVTFSNPLFDSNEDFNSSDDKSLSDEDVPKDNVLENFGSKDSYVSNLDEPSLLVTPLSDANEDECFDPGGDFDEIDAFLDIDVPTDIKDGYHDSEGDIIYFESLLINDTFPNLHPEVFLNRDPRSLEDEPDTDDLKNIVKVFNLGI